MSSRDGYREVRGGDASPLGAILPAGVVAVEAVGAVAPDPLLDGEAAAVARAVELRRTEYAVGRSCARRAMAIVEIAPMPILASADRAPIWPAGVIGSITHCRDYGCAAVALAGRWASIGIDAEVLTNLSPSIVERVLRPAERRHMAALGPGTPWPCVVFSIKEAVYKAVYPRIRRILEFEEVEVVLDADTRRFEARIVADSALSVAGSFCIAGPRVLSAVVCSR